MKFCAFSSQKYFMIIKLRWWSKFLCPDCNKLSGRFLWAFLELMITNCVWWLYWRVSRMDWTLLKLHFFKAPRKTKLELWKWFDILIFFPTPHLHAEEIRGNMWAPSLPLRDIKRTHQGSIFPRLTLLPPYISHKIYFFFKIIWKCLTNFWNYKDTSWKHYSQM